MTTALNPKRLASEIALAVCTDSQLSVEMGGTTPHHQDRLIEYVTGIVEGILVGTSREADGGEDFIEMERRTR